MKKTVLLFVTVILTFFFGVNVVCTISLQSCTFLANHGVKKANILLARAYIMGFNTDVIDLDVAKEQYELAGELENKNDLYNLASLYLLEEPKRKEAAFSLLLKAANKGHELAQLKTANMYLNGQGTEQNFEGAFKWYSKSAAQNNVESMYQLGTLYNEGKGTTRNFTKAFKLFYRAAENGQAGAQNDLALMYIQGTGVEKDLEQGLHWLYKSVEQGNLPAFYNLGTYYAEGSEIEGVSKDNVKAFAWFDIAYKNGLEEAKNWRGFVSEQLSLEDMIEAQTLSAKYQQMIEAGYLELEK
jgi:TPR repeat protein